MARLTRQLMRSNARYLAREAKVAQLHAEGAPNFTGDLISVMEQDVLLRMYAGASKTLATLVAGFAAAIQAEITYATYVTHGRKRDG